MRWRRRVAIAARHRPNHSRSRIVCHSSDHVGAESADSAATTPRLSSRSSAQAAHFCACRDWRGVRPSLSCTEPSCRERGNFGLSRKRLTAAASGWHSDRRLVGGVPPVSDVDGDEDDGGRGDAFNVNETADGRRGVAGSAAERAGSSVANTSFSPKRSNPHHSSSAPATSAAARSAARAVLVLVSASATAGSPSQASIARTATISVAVAARRARRASAQCRLPCGVAMAHMAAVAVPNRAVSATIACTTSECDTPGPVEPLPGLLKLPRAAFTEDSSQPHITSMYNHDPSCVAPAPQRRRVGLHLRG